MPICNFKRTKTHDKRTRVFKLGVEKSAPFLTKINQDYNRGDIMKFTVNNQEWQLLFVNPSNGNLKRSDGSITIGMTDNNSRTVYINNRLSDYMLDKCLAHELCHVYAFSFDYFMDIETEEIVADFFSLFGRSMVYMLDDLVRILKKAYIA